jgi:hypothetical protein
MMPAAYQLRPIVYGAPDQFVGWLDSVARLLELEPDEVFDDAGVKEAVGRLSRLIARRVDGPPVAAHPETWWDSHRSHGRALGAVGSA